MAEFWQQRRGPRWNRVFITAAEAERLIAKAYEAGRDDARAMPIEDEYGIRFLTDLQPGVGGTWLWLRPVARDQVPAEVVERLEAEAAGNATGAAGAC